MLTLLATLFGFASSFLPKLLDFFEKRSDAQHELDVIKARMEYAAQGVQMDIKKIESQGDEQARLAAYNFDNDSTDVKFIQALRGSVRPVITYLFLFVYIAIKLTVLHYGIYTQNTPAIEMVKVIWGENDMIIFMSIIGFYFGTRLVDKYNKNPWADGWPSYRADEVLTTARDVKVTTVPAASNPIVPPTTPKPATIPPKPTPTNQTVNNPGRHP